MFKGIGPEKGVFVEREDAYEYALNRCLNGSKEDKEEFKSMLVEWFYSGNWLEDSIKEEGEYS